MRCKKGLLDRPPPRDNDAQTPKPSEPRKAATWAEFALPLFKGGIYKPKPFPKERYSYNYDWKPARQTLPNRRNAPPVIFWPHELGANTQQVSANPVPARILSPSQHRRENAENLGLDVNASIGPETKPP